MLKELDKITYYILSFLKEADGQPVGATSICIYLRDKGMNLSEASVGRLLRGFDHDGLTNKHGKLGRVLSDNGEQKLSEIKETSWQQKWTDEFMESPDKVDKSYLQQLLDARLSVETAIARLAAENATMEQIEELRMIVNEQEKLAKSGAPVSTLDTEFHLKLAEASQNQILSAIAKLLRKKEESTRAMEYARRKSGRIYNMEHRKVFEAIEAHNPDLAELTMKRHIVSLKSML